MKLPNIPGLSIVREFWQHRSSQERLILSLGALVLGVLLIVYGIVFPLKDNIDSLQQQWQSNSELLSWIEPRLEAIKNQAQPAPVKRLSPDALLVTLDSEIKKSELGSAVTETSQTSNNGVQIRLKNAPFDRLLTWLAKQRDQYNIEVTQLSAQKTDTIGMVDVVMVLQVK